MTINKQALRQTAEKAQEHGVFNMDIHSETVLALLDELEAAEERYDDMLRQARSFREAHDYAAELIRKLERNKLVVKLPATKLWAGKVACYEASEVIALLSSVGVHIHGAEPVTDHTNQQFESLNRGNK